MSTSSTPSRSGSALDSPSPNNARERSSIELTPRSKVRAMLARFDGDSDEDIAPIRKKSIEEPQPPRTSSNLGRNIALVEDSDDEEDDVPVRARGGLAGRMKAAATIMKDGASDQNGGEDSAQSAYARVRKQLLASKTRKETEQQTKERIVRTEPSDASERESPIRPVHRKLLQKRRASPSSSPRSRQSPRSSPGLFVSPAKSQSAVGERPRPDVDSDSDSLPEDPLRDARIQAMAAQKRAERLAAEKAAKERKQASSDPITVAESDSNEDDAAAVRSKLTQESRPTRKASKKALMEMQRETQRMSRNMQLGYAEKTRKRYSTKDLFQKFNFRQNATIEEEQEVPRREHAQTDNEETSGIDGGMGLAASSDAEVMGNGGAETPPTSPLADDHSLLKKPPFLTADPIGSEANGDLADEEDLPDMHQLLSQQVTRVAKGKSRALDPPSRESSKIPSKALKVNVSGIQNETEIDLDSDDDLEILTSKPRSKNRLSVFDKVQPQKSRESHSLLVQRALAHLTPPGRAPTGKHKGKSSMKPAEMQAQLRQKAREQALKEKHDRVEELRARGIVVLTEEEKEQEQMQLENMLEKAREEARLLAKREKEARKNGEDYKGEGDIDMLSSEDDEEWIGEDGDEDGDADQSGDEDEEQEELQLSGSDDDEEGEENAAPNPLFDAEADEGDDEEEDDAPKPATAYDEDDDESLYAEPPNSEANHRPLANAKPRRRQVIDDEEEEDDQIPAKQGVITQPSEDDEMAAFGFAKVDTSPVSFTQMFAGSAANLDSQTQNTQTEMAAAMDTEHDSLAFLRQLPPPNLPDFRAEMPTTQVDDSQTQALDSQDPNTQTSPIINLGQSQFQFQETPSRFSEMLEPTQDAGFAVSQTMPTAPHSTTDTVLVPVPESPLVERKRGRLQQRKRHSTVLSDLDEKDSAIAGTFSDVFEQPLAAAEEDPVQAQMDAFNMMRTAAKKKAKKEAFDKKRSEAKEMVDEQAEESEDEYAGLGGASDDDSTGEVDEEVQKMMDDTHVDVDERQIAALFADKAKTDNEKAVNKLFNDLTTGALRRRRGGDLDLSDDDDDLAERRRRKQRDFARRTKALLEDEKIGKLAGDSKKQAFFHALEDRDYGEDLDFLDAPPDQASNTITDSQTDAPANNAAQDVTMAGALEPQTIPSTNPQKRKASDMMESMAHRRSGLTKRARNLSEVQESLSFLIDEPESIPESQSSDQDSDEEAGQMRPPPLRRDSTASRPVVNRLSLASLTGSALNAAANNGNAHTNGVNMAFQTSENVAPVFKVPSLLRRSTTNLSTASTTSSTSNSGTTTPTGVEIGGVKRGGSKKSNIHYQAREAERRKVVEEAERRRREGVKKKIAGRSLGGSVLGSLGGRRGGGFE